MRNATIDSLKGFAIILVVIGHVLQNTIIDYDENILFRLIYSFHMPLFFFLSGYVSKNKISVINLKKYFVALIIPFISFAIISSLYIGYQGIEDNYRVAHNIIKTLIYPDNGLWFLYVLFVIHILNYIASRTSILYVILIIVFITAISKVLDSQNVLGLRTIVIFSIYFFLGKYVFKNSEVITRNCSKFYVVLLIIFVCFGYFWHRTDNIYLLSINLSSVASFLYRYFVGLLGIFAFYGLFNKIKISKLALLGQHTLIIYVLNSYFMPFLKWLDFSNIYIIHLIFSTIIIIVLSLIFEYFIEKSKILSFLLLGKNNYFLNAK